MQDTEDRLLLFPNIRDVKGGATSPSRFALQDALSS